MFEDMDVGERSPYLFILLPLLMIMFLWLGSVGLWIVVCCRILERTLLEGGLAKNIDKESTKHGLWMGKREGRGIRSNPAGASF